MPSDDALPALPSSYEVGVPEVEETEATDGSTQNQSPRDDAEGQNGAPPPRPSTRLADGTLEITAPHPDGSPR